MEEYFNSLEDKSNSLKPPILGLAEDQKSFNAASNHIFLHFRAAIMDFLIILNCSVFFSNNFVECVLQIKIKL